jgi:hypothetical protein
MADKSETIAELLKQLQQNGAEVKEKNIQGTSIAPKVLSDLQANASPDFDAWISWTKSF